MTDKNCFEFQTSQALRHEKQGKCRVAIYGGFEKQISDFVDNFYYDPDVFLVLVNDCGRPFKEIPVLKGSYFKKPFEYLPEKKYALMDFNPEVISEPDILKCPWGRENILFVYDLEKAGFNPTQRAVQHLKAGAVCAVIDETGVCYSKTVNSQSKEIIQADIDAAGRDENDYEIRSCIYECLHNGAGQARLILNEDEFNIYLPGQTALKYKKNPKTGSYLVFSLSSRYEEELKDRAGNDKKIIPFSKASFLFKGRDGSR